MKVTELKNSLNVYRVTTHLNDIFAQNIPHSTDPLHSSYTVNNKYTMPWCDHQFRTFCDWALLGHVTQFK